MRINRTTAQFRDRDRLGATGKGNVQEQACAYLWQELNGARWNEPYHHAGKSLIYSFLFFIGFFSSSWVNKANWKRRAEIIDYCVQVMDETQVRQSDQCSGDAGNHHHPPLSIGVTDETKVDMIMGFHLTSTGPCH
jgi:hypothetical protein